MLVHVVPALDAFGQLRSLARSLQEDEIAAGAQILRFTAQAIGGAETDCRVKVGDVVERLAEIVAIERAELIVVGGSSVPRLFRHRSGMWSRVADAIACPVVVVPTEQSRADGTTGSFAGGLEITVPDHELVRR